MYITIDNVYFYIIPLHDLVGHGNPLYQDTRRPWDHTEINTMTGRSVMLDY